MSKFLPDTFNDMPNFKDLFNENWFDDLWHGTDFKKNVSKVTSTAYTFEEDKDKWVYKLELPSNAELDKLDASIIGNQLVVNIPKKQEKVTKITVKKE